MSLDVAPDETMVLAAVVTLKRFSIVGLVVTRHLRLNMCVTLLQRGCGRADERLVPCPVLALSFSHLCGAVDIFVHLIRRCFEFKILVNDEWSVIHFLRLW